MEALGTRYCPGQAEPPILGLGTGDTRRGRAVPPLSLIHPLQLPGVQSPAELTDSTCAAAAAAFPSPGIDYGATLSRCKSIYSHINLSRV